jgi:hypothetical protein
LSSATPRRTCSRILAELTLCKGGCLQGFSVRLDREVAARLLPTIAPSAPTQTTENLTCRANEETGATGLEPATSGVTGRRSNQLNYAPSAAAL